MKPDLKIVLSTDALHPPLTGIGRYTYELLNRLHLNRSVFGIADLDGFLHGRVETPIEALRRVEHASQHSEASSVPRPSLRTLAAKSVWAVRLYQLWLKSSAKSVTRRYARDGYLFHSTNFIVPEFAGNKIVTIHDLSVLKYPQHHPKSRVELVAAHIHRAKRERINVITVSEAVRRELIDELKFNGDLVTAIPLAPRFHQSPTDRPPTPLPAALENRPFFLCVSTVEPRKNLNKVIDAYTRLSREHRQAHPLVIVGNAGWGTSEIHNRIRQLVRGPDVFYFGFVPDDLLAGLYRSALCLVYTSIYEGFGLPIVEAQSCGTPVITSNCSSMPEAAGRAALLVEPHSIEQIQCAMRTLIDAPDVRNDLIRKGLAHAASLSWAQTVEATIQLYRRILDGH